MMRLRKHTRSVVVWGRLLVSVLVSTSLATALEVGEQAPDFTLSSTTGETIALRQYREKQWVLLEFYIGGGIPAEHPTWAANLSARKADYKTFQALNVQILGIGADHPFVQKTFADSLELPYPLLSDHPDLQVIRRYGVLSLSQIGPHPPETTARRSFFLVDPQGMVRGRWLAEPKEVVPSETILEVARKLVGKR